MPANNEFTITKAFTLDEGFGHRLNVMLTHDNETGKLSSVSFSDPDRDAMVAVPGDLWERVKAAIARQEEF